MYKAAPVALALLLASALVPSPAAAYQVRKTSDGLPVHWDAETITLVADESLKKLDPASIDAVARAFAAWSTVSGSTGPGVILTEGSIDEVGYHEGAVNMNTIRYAPHGYAAAGGALAITVLTFDASGKILDADIVINGGGSRGFAILANSSAKGLKSDAVLGAPYDLEDVLTHEAGHLFGLAHNDGEADATMYFATARGEVKKRDLTTDDEEGYRALYPQTRESTAACSATPAPSSSRASFAAGAMVVASAVLRGARRRFRARDSEST